MKIKNLTSQRQVLSAQELTGNRMFTISVEGGGTVELINMYVPHLDSKLFALLDAVSATTEETLDTTLDEKEEHPIEDTDLREESNIEEEEPPEQIKEPAEENKNSSQFICDVCGSEFASARGLNTHMRKAHSEE